MTILLWAFFGIINALLLRSLVKGERGNAIISAGVGALGAISGGFVAYALFKPQLFSLSHLSIGVIVLEAVLFLLLLSGKAFTQRAI